MANNVTPHTLLLPIENVFRELDWKLVFAALSVDEDTVVYLGQHDYLYEFSKGLQSGIYIGKNSMSRKTDGSWFSDRHVDMRSRGIKVIHFDEEGAVYYGDEDDWVIKLTKVRTDIQTFNDNDTIFTWGEFQANVFADQSNVKQENVLNMGHPRFDMLGPKYNEYFNDEVSKIKNKYGNFILVNCNFALYNNSLGNKDSFSLRFGYNLSTEETRQNHIALWSYTGKTQIEYIKLVSELSGEFPDTKIVLRPHPSESKEIYEMIFGDITNVSVVREGNVAAWILASDLVLHDGCTTGLEAFFSGTPVINYKPSSEEGYDLFLANSVGVKCSRKEELTELIKKLLNGKPLDDYAQISSDRSRSLLRNLDPASDSFVSLVSYVQGLKKSLARGKINLGRFYLFRLAYWCSFYLKSFIRPLFRDRQKSFLAFRNLFPGFSKEFLEGKKVSLEKLSQKTLNLRMIDRNLIEIKVARK